MFLQFGINDYKTCVKESKSFVRLEAKKADQHLNVILFGIYGLRYFGITNQLVPVFYNSIPFSILESFIDKDIRLNISKPEKGLNAFDQPLGKSNMDYNWLFLFLGSALFLSLGFITYHKKEDYIKFLLNFANYRTVYAAVFVSKILIIIGFLVFSFLAIILQYQLFNGIQLGSIELRNLAIFFFVTCFAVYIISFSLGMIFGKLKSTLNGVSLTVISWLLLVILIPEIFNVMLAKHTKSMFDSIYALELNKLEIYTKAEQSILEKVSKLNAPDEIKKAYKRLIQQYLEGDFKKIVALEENMLINTKRAAKKVHFFSIFTPVTFYKSVGNEISGYSYKGLISFYRVSLKKYQRFVNYCFENTIDGKRPKDNPFIKNPDDYIVHLKSSLPHYFKSGLLLQLFYILVLFTIDFFRFRRFIFPSEKNKVFSNIDLKLEKGKHYVFSYMRDEHHVPEQIYNVFWGTAGKFSGKISIDGGSIVNQEKKNFVYLPVPDSLPGKLKVKTIINFLAGLFNVSKSENKKVKEEFKKILNKEFEEIKDVEKTHIMLRMAEYKKSDIYLLHDFFFHIDKPEILISVLDDLKKNGIIIVEVNYFSYITKKPDRTSIIRTCESEKYEEILVDPL